MALGGDICMDVPESHTSDSELSVDRNELGDVPLGGKPPSISGVKAIVSSSSGVHELLECPVCTYSMYPPMHQVCCSFPVLVVYSIVLWF